MTQQHRARLELLARAYLVLLAVAIACNLVGLIMIFFYPFLTSLFGVVGMISALVMIFLCFYASRLSGEVDEENHE